MLLAGSCVGAWCTSGQCGPGYADCNGDPNGDGCESTLATDPNNCGACGAVCSTWNISSTCSSGRCNVGSCASGWADCNGDKLGDGCEALLAGDLAHCGGCGLACSTNHVTPACQGGSCSTGVCAAGWADWGRSAGHPLKGSPPGRSVCPSSLDRPASPRRPRPARRLGLTPSSAPRRLPLAGRRGASSACFMSSHTLSIREEDA
jgi:hypothetical protein